LFYVISASIRVSCNSEDFLFSIDLEVSHITYDRSRLEGSIEDASIIAKIVKVAKLIKSNSIDFFSVIVDAPFHAREVILISISQILLVIGESLDAE